MYFKANKILTLPRPQTKAVRAWGPGAPWWQSAEAKWVLLFNSNPILPLKFQAWIATLNHQHIKRSISSEKRGFFPGPGSWLFKKMFSNRKGSLKGTTRTWKFGEIYSNNSLLERKILGTAKELTGHKYFIIKMITSSNYFKNQTVNHPAPTSRALTCPHPEAWAVVDSDLAEQPEARHEIKLSSTGEKCSSQCWTIQDWNESRSAPPCHSHSLQPLFLRILLTLSSKVREANQRNLESHCLHMRKPLPGNYKHIQERALTPGD